MATYQYNWEEVITIRLEVWAEKVKVSPWEIIQSNIEERHFTWNWFKKLEVETKVIDDWKDDITLSIKKKK